MFLRGLCVCFVDPFLTGLFSASTKVRHAFLLKLVVSVHKSDSVPSLAQVASLYQRIAAVDLLSGEGMEATAIETTEVTTSSSPHSRARAYLHSSTQIRSQLLQHAMESVPVEFPAGSKCLPAALGASLIDSLGECGWRWADMVTTHVAQSNSLFQCSCLRVLQVHGVDGLIATLEGGRGERPLKIPIGPQSVDQHKIATTKNVEQLILDVFQLWAHLGVSWNDLDATSRRLAVRLVTAAVVMPLGFRDTGIDVDKLTTQGLRALASMGATWSSLPTRPR